MCCLRSGSVERKTAAATALTSSARPMALASDGEGAGLPSPNIVDLYHLKLVDQTVQSGEGRCVLRGIERQPGPARPARGGLALKHRRERQIDLFAARARKADGMGEKGGLAGRRQIQAPANGAFT